MMLAANYAEDKLVNTWKLLGLHCHVLYTGAVHRFYESRRRLFNDEQPGRVEAANTTKKNSKQTVLRKQVIVVLSIEYCMYGLIGKKFNVAKCFCIPPISL